MLEKLRQRTSRDEGFTLVELLVVMLILGILAAIAIPAFFSQRDKAKDTDAKSTVRTAQTAIESYATDNNGSYLGATNTNLNAIEPTVPTAVTKLTVTPSGTATASGYTLTAISGTGNTFSITRAATGGAVTYPCTVTGGTTSAGCPTTLLWKP